METKAGAQISKKAFFQSVYILAFLMLIAGILTRTIPAGQYQRTITEGRQMIEPGSFAYTPRPDYPVWRWLTAPFEALAGPDGLVLIVIIVFIVLVGASFAVLEKSGILHAALSAIVKKFGGKKYLLLMMISLFFMLMGAFFGIFEEIVPLVPLMIALAYYLGWDALIGLGMSILATNMGFSAALTNPFTIGVAQKLAGLPPFSGFAFRIPIFITIYAVLVIFLLRYAKRIDRQPESSLIFDSDQAERVKYRQLDLDTLRTDQDKLTGATIWFLCFVILIVFTLVGSSFISFLTDYALPLVGVLFFLGGLGAGILAGTRGQALRRALLEGIGGVAPAVPLIMMAGSIKHIVTTGGVMDTILNSASQPLAGASPLLAVLIIYLLALFIELFIGSAGAKAVLMMPILLPLADLVGVTRQVTVLAYCFGDGFSNMAYPTNPVLLIALGLAAISYGKWMRWTLRLWAVVIPISIFFLWLSIAIGYGPF
jgi:uncharacterized ion transporter superfamily protein YfcC